MVVGQGNRTIKLDIGECINMGHSPRYIFYHSGKNPERRGTLEVWKKQWLTLNNVKISE